MPRLPLVVFLVLLWHAIGADFASAQTPGFCEGGKQSHANGDVYGYRYVVVFDDTLYSIAMRFCTSVGELQRLNGIQNPNWLPAGTTLIIPGLGPTPTQGCSWPYVSITSPASGATVGSPFNVSGQGCGAAQGEVIIRVQDSAGYEVGRFPAPIIRSSASEAAYTFSAFVPIVSGQGAALRLRAEAPNATSDTVQVTFFGMPAACSPSAPFAIYEPRADPQAPYTFDVSGAAGSNCRVTVTVTAREGNVILGEASADSGASTQWRTRLTLRYAVSNDSYIVFEAQNIQTGARAYTTIIFRGASGDRYRNLDPTRCQLQLVATSTGVYSLANPDGPKVRLLSSNGYLAARRVVQFNGQLWYAITLAYNEPDEWVPASVVRASNDCGL